MAKTTEIDLGALLKAAISDEEKKIWDNQDVQIEHSGKKIILPADPKEMSLEAGIETLHRFKKDAETKYRVVELVAGAPWDSAVAVYRAMVKIYGLVSPQARQTFFGKVPPEFLSVRVGPGAKDFISVPTGRVVLPNVEAPVDIHLHPKGVYIIGEVHKADRARILEIAVEARQLIKSDSVYKSKSITINVDEEGQLQLTEQPEFMDLSAVKESDLIHPRDVTKLIQSTVFTPLKHTDACRKNGIPLKRGILMSGPYGTGKTLTARVTAKVANDNGWTFMTLSRSQGLKAALELAKMYQPCVIFAEDMDRAGDRRNEKVNDLVNQLDGVDTKNAEIMVVLTTNFIDNIDPSLLRPGRFDAVIHLRNCDPETAERLVRLYSGKLMPEDADLKEASEALDDVPASSVRETVERAKLVMLSEDRKTLCGDDVYVAAIGMNSHNALLKKRTDVETPKDLLWKGMLGALRQANGTAEGDLVPVLTKAIDDIVEKHVG